MRQVRRRLDNPPAEITDLAADRLLRFIPAELLGVSPVLAAVTAGIYLGWHTPELTTSQVRLQGLAVWEIVQYLLNALLFVLVGLQLPVVVDGLEDVSAGRLVGYAALVSLTVIGLRFLWVFASIDAPKRLAATDVELAAASSSPGPGCAARSRWPRRSRSRSRPTHGEPFPGRDLILFLTFAVILVTLVGQGLTLPLVIRALGLEDDGLEDREDAKARIHAAEAALARLEELADEDWVREDTAERRPRRVPVPDRRASAPASTTGRRHDRERARRTTSACAASCSRRSGRPRRAPPERRDLERRLDPRRARPRPRGSAARHLRAPGF